MPLILQHRIYRQDLKNNPDCFYVFGDNEERWGLGGQAKEMRGEPNAIGIATLKAPGVFWSEDNLEHQKYVIRCDSAYVENALSKGKTVIFPSDGIGTGLASLPEKSPTTFEYLLQRVESWKNIVPQKKMNWGDIPALTQIRTIRYAEEFVKHRDETVADFVQGLWDMLSKPLKEENYAER